MKLTAREKIRARIIHKHNNKYATRADRISIANQLWALSMNRGVGLPSLLIPTTLDQQIELLDHLDKFHLKFVSTRTRHTANETRDSIRSQRLQALTKTLFTKYCKVNGLKNNKKNYCNWLAKQFTDSQSNVYKLLDGSPHACLLDTQPTAEWIKRHLGKYK
jgi:hypothetical protein